MAKLKISKSSTGKPSAPVKEDKIKIDLPEEPSEPSNDLSDFHLLVHGEKKIGKTTLAVAEPDVLLITFDPLQKAQRIMQIHCPSWKHFMATLEAIEARVKAGRAYKRVVIDGADIWYRSCQEYICKKLVIKHPSDAEWGKGWDMLKQTFASAVDRVLALPGGTWIISHSDWKEIETRKKGFKIEKLVPLLKAGGEEILVGRVDAWFAYDYEGDERVLIIQGDERTGAGHRIKGHFETPSGRRVKEIPMGDTEQEAWDNLQKAFRNEQKFISLEERDDKQKEKKGGPGKKKVELKLPGKNSGKK